MVSIIGDKDLRLVTEIALNLHQFQYNGFDRDAEVPPYSREEFAGRDIEFIINFIRDSFGFHDYS
ncbi:MAG: PaREP1 family protein [Sulfolobaceae archaeon]|jgi:hypothetical protein